MGDSHLQIDAPQFYTGTTTIGGGKIITTIGDSAFCAASNPILLNNGAIQVSNNIWNSNRTIYAGSGVLALIGVYVLYKARVRRREVT